MKHHTQRILAAPDSDAGNDENGIPGDCLRAAIASSLDLEFDDVPHFSLVEIPLATICDSRVGAAEEHYRLWWYALIGWASYEGWDVTLVPREDEFFEYYMTEYFDGPVILTGDSPRGRGRFLHSMVWRPERWDPHPSRAGLPEIRDLIVFHPRSEDV